MTSRPTTPTKSAVVFSIFCLAAFIGLPSLGLIEPGDSSPVARMAYRHPDLTIINAYQSVADLPTSLVATARDDLARLGATTHTARLDLRSGRWGTLVLSEPLVPGDGVGNSLRWDSLKRAAPESREDFEQAAWQAFTGFVAGRQSELRLDANELSEQSRVVTVHDDGRLIQIHAPREIDGVPVRGSYLTAVVNHGNLILLGAKTWGDAVVPAVPRLSADDAIAAGNDYLSQFPTERWTKPRLVFIPLARGSALEQVQPTAGYDYRLAWELRPTLSPDPLAQDPFAATDHGTWELLVDAHSGEILAFEDKNHYATNRKVTGGVYPVSNDGTAPDGVSQPGWPMPYETIITQSGSATTDAGGQLPSPIDGNITSDLAGVYVRILDQCGTISLTSSGDLDFGTSGGDDCTTPGVGGPGNTHSSRSAYFELNRVIEQARGQLPGNSWLQQRLTSNMNINSSCNAFYNGTVNFYRSGGGCGNTGEIAAVTDHEWGHGMDDHDASPFVSNPGEGIADAYAYLRLNDSCIGRNFRSTNCGGCTDCTGVREIDWGKHFPAQPHDVAWIDANCGSGPAPCGGGVHCEGRVYAEAIFDLVNRDLPAFHGMDHNTALEVGTRLTYLGSGPVGSWYQCTTPFGGCNADGGYLNFLAADDDNGNLADGTPHMSAIFSAFDRHGIACNSPTVQDGGCAGAPTSAPTVAAAPVDRGALLSWTTVPGATRYDVFRTDGVFACDFGKAKVGEVTGTSFTDSGLQNGRDYYYIVVPVGSADTCMGPASACTTVSPASGPNLGIDDASAVLTIASGDGDDFLDNCENATWNFPIDNTGAGTHTNVRITAITPSNPAITINTPLPATVTSFLAEGASANASFSFTASGLSTQETVSFTVEVTSNELDPLFASAALTTFFAESDFQNVASRTWTFESGTEGWQVIEGTFNRTSNGGGAQATTWYEASSDNLSQQCDHIRSPAVVLTPTSTLSLWNQFDIEPIFGGSIWYDRANLGLYDVDTDNRTPVDPDSGRLYNATGDRGSCGTTDQNGWADQALTWGQSSWSATALGSAGFAGRPVQLDIQYGTDQFLEGFGFRFDQVTLTNFQELGPDNQPDTCSCNVDADCIDALYCNGTESCVGGVCQAGTPVACDDGVACTDNICDESTDSCTFPPNDAFCSNGIFCDGTEVCDPVFDCQNLPPVDCDDGIACTVDACNEDADACDNLPDDSVCDNGLFCDGAEVCTPLFGCQTGPAVNCDDGVGCTVDACNEGTDACDNTADDSLCDNGLFCDGSEFCDPTLDCQDGPDPCFFGCDDGADLCVQPTSFACTGDAYIIQNENAQLTRVDQSVSPFVFVDIGSPTDIEINSLGFRSTDGLLYGLELTTGGNVQIVMIDANGDVFGLGRPDGLPSGVRFDAGDISPDGTTMYITGTNQDLYVLDLTSSPTLPAVTTVDLTGAGGFVFDWAVNPADGMLYGGDSTNGQLARIDPTTGVRVDVFVDGLPSGSGYGGAWFDASGNLFLYQNNGFIYEVDLSGPTVVDTQTGAGATRNDGAACVVQVPAIAITLSGVLDLGGNGIAEPGDTIVYSYQIDNTGGLPLTDVTISDADVPTISCPGGYPIASLPTGASVTCTGTYTITQTDIDAGVKVTTATASGDDPGIDPVTDQDSTSVDIPAPPAAGLSLVKTGALDLGGNGTADPGDVISYTFVITNTGGATLTDVTVSDPLVPSISCPSGQPIPSLTTGASETCTGSYAITQADIDAGVRDNTATVSGDDQGSPVTDQDSHSEVIPNGGVVPFACTGDAYIVQDQNAQLTVIDQSVSPFVFVPIGGPTGIEINNLGFRITDGLLYGLELTSGGNVQIVSIDATGTVTGLGRPAGLPSGPRFDAGDVSPDGTTMYITSNNQALYSVDLTQLPTLPAVTSVPVSGAAGFVFDWAVSPVDGMLYGGDSTSGQLAMINPATGQRTDVNLSGLPSGSGYGGAWFDAAGTLFLYQNSGVIYEIDLAGPTVVSTQSGPGASRNDGAACIDQGPLPAEIQLVKTGSLDLGSNGTTDVGDVIDYSFQVTNSGGVDLTDVTITDPLIASVSCPGGHPIPSLAAGASMTCTASYAITQADVDAGVRDNTATVSGDDQGSPVTDQDSHSETIPPPPGDGPVPFGCTGDAYIVQNQNAQLTRIDQSVSPFVFVNIGSPTGIEINNLGFRVTDGMLYGLELTSGGNAQIVRIDATGAVEGLGRPAGLPAGPRFDAGDVSPDGTTMYITSNNQALYSVDLTQLPTLPAVTSVPVSGAAGFVFDWAVSPIDGMLYGGDSTSGQLAMINPATGQRTDVNLAGLPSGSGYGGAWFDAVGTLFLYQNSGVLYEIDLAGPTVVSTQTGPGASRNDGAACIDQGPLPAEIQLVKTGSLDLGGNGTTDVGDVIDYSFQITNSGGVDLTDVTITDPLVASVSCPGGHPIPSLATSASMTCTASYAITQADVDAGLRNNTATVSGDDQGSPVTDQDSHSETIPPPPGNGPVPFACTGDAYIVQNQNAQLTRIDQSVSPFVFVDIGSPTGIEINNLGFRITDGLLYGVELNANGNTEIVRIDATGTVEELGRPAGLPAGPRFDAGDVSPDGTTMYITAINRDLYVLDLTQVPTLPAVTTIDVTGANGFVFDWAVSPIDGMLYGGDSTSGQLAMLNPTTGVRTDVNLAGLPSGAGYGGAWFDNTGTLFLYQNSGVLYEIDLAGPTVVSTQTGPGASRNDGAACVPPAP